MGFLFIKNLSIVLYVLSRIFDHTVMAEKKNQHYVPQYYFKYFNNHQKFISILLINPRKIINRSSVADQASLPYFYGDSDVENKICVIENSNRKALNKIL